MRRRSLLTVCAVLAARPALAQCGIGARSTLPLRVIDGFPLVDATIGGLPVTFLLDTGAQAHLILPEAQAILRLPYLPGTVPLIGTGGTTQAQIVRLDGVKLGTIALDPTAAPIAPLPATPQVSPILAGLLGVPLLEQFDLELDGPASRLALLNVTSCPEPQLGQRLISVPLTPTRDRRALLQVRINGVTLTALLDTGSRATLLTEEAAARLGLRAPLSANTAQGVDGGRLPVAHLRVAEMRIGDDVRRNAPVSIAPLHLEGADMLLGFDYFRQRHVRISFRLSELLIALPSPASSAPGLPPLPPPGRARP